ncbi:hypothetical protein HBA55_29885 [Pseudomaricurvus alkylphenolicus]|uniref:hypothetical protein n=1 Tax=Pseudomaricurvus alkylphenolicus TaxID=1306991 RepID=UPI0014247BA2|nr:hypothetical protein [Pseudomaricurvus alkylphenolicus]NIB43851.1 hypothetical protein [Pseudomaricurvus alkylphenolicus]
MALPVQASTPAQERDRLERYQQAMENRTSELEAIDNQLYGYQHKLAEAEQDLQTQQQELNKARSSADSARQTHSNSPSEDSARALKLAEHRLKMAERGVRTRTKRVERIQNRQAMLNQSRDDVVASLEDDEQRITAQHSKIANAERQAQAREKERVRLLAQAEEARRRAEQEMAAKAKRERELELAAREKARRMAAAKQVQEASSPQQNANSLSDRTGITETVISATSATPQTLSPSPEMTELDREALAYAQKEIERLEKLVAEGGNSRATFKRLTLKGSKLGTSEFEFLGQNQYRVDTQVTKGRQIIQIGKHKFRRTIPASDDGSEYVFIFDAKRPSRPRLVMFRKSLLQHL